MNSLTYLHILESYKEAKVGFGAGHNLKTSILQAIFDCPFFRPGIKVLSNLLKEHFVEYSSTVLLKFSV